jgi:hypothetical protein
MKTYETLSGLPHVLKEGTDAERVAWCTYRGMVSGSRGMVEDMKVTMAIRDARARGYEDMVRAIWFGARAYRLEWLTLTQRQWQRDTRRASRARHHDSIAIREKYVRCQP